jgi:hypothetical protein
MQSGISDCLWIRDFVNDADNAILYSHAYHMWIGVHLLHIQLWSTNTDHQNTSNRDTIHKIQIIAEKEKQEERDDTQYRI